MAVRLARLTVRIEVPFPLGPNFPAHHALVLLLDETNALKDIGDIIYAPLLHLQGGSCRVEIQHPASGYDVAGAIRLRRLRLGIGQKLAELASQ